MNRKFKFFPKLNGDRILNVLSLIIAIFSFVFSAFGVSIADRAQTYTENLENSRRSIVLEGDTGSQEDSLTIAPLQQGMRFLQGYAYFPNEIIDRAVPIDSKGHVRWMGSIMANIEQHIWKNTPALDGYVSISEGEIPLVIYSNYAFEGQVYEDWSLYTATYIAQVGRKETGGLTKANLTGLIYRYRMNAMDEEEAKHTPEALWNSMKEQDFGLPWPAE